MRDGLALLHFAAGFAAPAGAATVRLAASTGDNLITLDLTLDLVSSVCL
jgi:hypothetical protein